MGESAQGAKGPGAEQFRIEAIFSLA